jgi:hypothetical protein
MIHHRIIWRRLTEQMNVFLKFSLGNLLKLVGDDLGHFHFS